MVAAVGSNSVAGLDLSQIGTSSSSNGSSGSSGQSSSNISGPGQLLSELQQLQTQDPKKFKQVVNDIASKLQSAAQSQGQSAQGDFLTNLAKKFQDVANGSNLSQLQPPKHNHGHHAHHSYSQNSHDATQGIAGLSANNNPSPATDLLQSLFSSIKTEVSQALSS